MEINPYTALGVPPTASREEIKELFQTKTNDFLRLESLERLQLSDVILARSAYNLLMDESWRKAYDTSQKRKQEILDKQQRGIQDYINSLPDQAKRGRLEALMGEVPGVKSSNRDYGSSASSSASSTETLRDSSPPPPHGWWRSTSDERTTLFGHKQKTRAGSPWMLVFWLILLALFILPAIAALLVFLLKPTFHPPARLPPPLPLPVPYTRNIAIIGGGPAGMSVAYHLKEQADADHIPVNITIYESSERLCSRTSVVRHLYGLDSEPVELGVTSFPPKGTLARIVDNLVVRTEITTNTYPGMGGSGETSFGVYDDSDLVYLEPNPGGFLSRMWLRLKLHHRYGSSPGKADKLIQSLQGKVQKLYSSPVFPFNNIDDAVASSGLDKEASSPADEFLNGRGIAENFQRELINPWVRRSKAQNLGTISALGALASVPGKSFLKMGESRFTEVCDKMAINSGARVLLGTAVHGVQRSHSGGWEVASRSVGAREDSHEAFDGVVLAAPWDTARLEVKPLPLQHTPPVIPYADLYITLFTSPYQLSPKVFPGMSPPPGHILTTPNSKEYEQASGISGPAGVGRIGYWSISLLKEVTHVLNNPGSVQREYLYKIMSAKQLSNGEIERLIGKGRSGITWIDRYHSAAAYPYQLPLSSFGPIQLDENFWYTAAIHELAGGAEMSALMGANVAQLIASQWEQLGSPPPANSSTLLSSDEERMLVD